MDAYRLVWWEEGMTSQFITNQEKLLSEVINNILPSSRNLYFLVGYFYFSGFQEIYEKVAEKNVKILVGLEIDQDLMNRVREFEVLQETHASRGMVRDNYYKALVKLFNESDFFDSEEKQNAFKLFLEKMENGTLEIRKTLHSNHAKLYVFENREVTYVFDSYTSGALDWSDSADDSSTGSTALGFSVTIGGATYSYFDMSSDGYIELLTDACDVPTGRGYDSIDGLISADPCATYLLAAYDDLDSSAYDYYGYKLLSGPNRAVFYYDTETYQDTASGPAQLNNFEVILYEDGNVQWNFNYAEYSFSLLDLFSGLYFGNTQTLLELDRYHIPEQESYLYYGCDDWLTTDFNNDCFTDLADFSIFALQWLKCAELNDPGCQP